MSVFPPKLFAVPRVQTCGARRCSLDAVPGGSQNTAGLPAPFQLPIQHSEGSFGESCPTQPFLNLLMPKKMSNSTLQKPGKLPVPLNYWILLCWMINAYTVFLTGKDYYTRDPRVLWEVCKPQKCLCNHYSPLSAHCKFPQFSTWSGMLLDTPFKKNGVRN